MNALEPEPGAVLVVTGGSRGIGAATAKLAARTFGCAICLSYQSNQQAAHQCVADIEASGGVARAVQAEMSQPEEIARLFAAADEMGRLAGLVNNAGTLEAGQRVDDMDAARLGRIFGANITGSFLCAGEAIKRMSTRYGGKGGAIVNLSSVAATLGAGGAMVDYAASKGAIETFTVGLAHEVSGEGIRVNAVRPGIIDTEIHALTGDPGRVARLGAEVPLGRAGSAEEVAEAIVWLLSVKSSYTIGDVITVAGGRGAHT